MRLRELCRFRIRKALALPSPQQYEVQRCQKRMGRLGMPGALLLAALAAPSWATAATEGHRPDPAPASTSGVPGNADEQLVQALALLEQAPEAAIDQLQALWDDTESPFRSAAGMGLLRAHHALGQHRQVLEIGEVLLALPGLDHQDRSRANRLRFFSAMRLGDRAAMAAESAELEFKLPEPHSPSRPLEESVLDNPFIYGGLIALAILLCLRWLVALGTSLVSLGLYLERVEGDANVESEYRRFGLFPRVRYSIWTPGGMLTGTAPAWCARKGLVTIAWRPQHRFWRRPRGLMLEDVLLAASLLLAWPFVVAIRVVIALRV